MMVSILRRNHVLQAAILSGAAGTAVYVLKWMVERVYHSCISSHLYSYITIRNSDSEYFNAVLDFIHAQGLQDGGHLMACRPRWHADAKAPTAYDDALGEIHYQPADSGSPISMMYRGRLIFVSRSSGQTLTVGANNDVMRVEALSLSVMGRDPAILKTLISDAIAWANRRGEGFVRIFVQTQGWCPDWTWVLSKRLRSFDTLALGDSASRDIVGDARTFLESRRWYEEMGIPHRRGYLLHGPPGCGKTSFCHALAGALRLDICTMNTAGRGLSDSRLVSLLRDAPLRSIVIMEDVDAAFKQREGGCNQESSVTFSGLINAIDGIASQEGRIFIMTTNHIGRLDPALLRPGRCDIKIHFDWASREQLRAMFLRFFPAHEDEARHFADQLPEGKLSLAQIQGFLVKQRDSAERAVEMASELIRKGGA